MKTAILFSLSIGFMAGVLADKTPRPAVWNLIAASDTPADPIAELITSMEHECGDNPTLAWCAGVRVKR